MSEWWTYTLSDLLMFSPRTYYRLFELYNLAVWPAQLIALALGAAILLSWWRSRPWAGRAVAAILAAAWLWVAWAYLFERYDTINWAARWFAVGFAAQALLLMWTGGVRNRLNFATPLRPSPDQPGGRLFETQPPRAAAAPQVEGRRSVARRAGLALFLFALVAYPLIAPLLGRPWTQAEVFALAPDPTVAATLGVLLAADRRHSLLLVIPLLWCAISGVTLWTMQSPEAPILPAAAGLTVAVAAWKTMRGMATRSHPPREGLEGEGRSPEL